MAIFLTERLLIQVLVKSNQILMLFFGASANPSSGQIQSGQDAILR